MVSSKISEGFLTRAGGQRGKGHSKAERPIDNRPQLGELPHIGFHLLDLHGDRLVDAFARLLTCGQGIAGVAAWPDFEAAAQRLRRLMMVKTEYTNTKATRIQVYRTRVAMLKLWHEACHSSVG